MPICLVPLVLIGTAIIASVKNFLLEEFTNLRRLFNRITNLCDGLCGNPIAVQKAVIWKSCSRLSKEVHMFGSRDINPPEKVVIGGTIGNLQRGHRSLVVGLLLLALTLTGGGWYAYQALNRHEVALTNIVVAMSDQVRSTSEMLASWADDKHNLRDQISKLDQTMETRIAAVTNQTLAFTSEMYRRKQTAAPLMHSDKNWPYIAWTSRSRRTIAASLLKAFRWASSTQIRSIAARAAGCG